MNAQDPHGSCAFMFWARVLGASFLGSAAAVPSETRQAPRISSGLATAPAAVAATEMARAKATS
ncbi:MAG: hypothetical protein ABIN10_00525, partial [Specibacter sp.]